jgi:ribosomal-protein-alanine N-acetyltransferase
MITLRPVQEHELPLVLRIHTDPAVPGDFQWFGFRPKRAIDLERRFAEDGLVGSDSSTLAIALDDGTCAGVVSHRPAGDQGNLEIGICVFPEHRGRGIGTEAQRLLVDHLLATTPAHRIQAMTELGNVAEERALERVGFTREGVFRGYGFRDGAVVADVGCSAIGVIRPRSRCDHADRGADGCRSMGSAPGRRGRPSRATR